MLLYKHCIFFTNVVTLFRTNRGDVLAVIKRVKMR